MTTPAHAAPLPALMQRLAAVFRPLHTRGVLMDGPAHRHATTTVSEPGVVATIPASQLVLFVDRLRQLLASADEVARRRLEREVLDLAVPLQAAGLFDVLHIAHTPLATMVADHLAGAGSQR